jgi:hypothetical protein
MRRTTATHALVAAAALLCVGEQPALASDDQVMGVVLKEEALSRLSVGLDLRVRGTLYEAQGSVVRASAGFALMEPAGGEDGPRVDVFAGLGQEAGLYAEAGLRTGYEYGLWPGGVFALTYELSVSAEESLTAGGVLWSDAPTTETLYEAVLHNHRVGVEVGFQRSLRARLGLGMGRALTQRGEPEVPGARGYLFADAGFVWQL